MINEEIIKKKLNILRENLEQIKEILKSSNVEIENNRVFLSAMERNFQLIVDAAVGINEHIISEENLQLPDDYFRTFLILGTASVLPLKFAEKIAPSVGLRNQIVHQYEKIDVDKMLKDIKENIHQYDEYMGLIIKRYKLA